jgi:hypothetical protein
MEPTRDLWHLAFANLVQHRAPPNFEVQTEVRLTIEPQRADILLLRRLGADPADDRAEVLRTLWPKLGKVTVLEYKSPVASSFRPGDLVGLLGYGDLYATAHFAELPSRADLTLALVLPSITPTLLKEIAWLGAILVPLGGGYSRIDGLLYVIYVAATDEVSDAERDEFLALFSHHRVKQGAATHWLQEWMRDAKMKQPNIEEVPGWNEMMRRFLDRLPVEERLEGLVPEEIAARLNPALPLDRLLPTLPLELLRGLSEEYLRSLPPEVLDQVRRRLRAAAD